VPEHVPDCDAFLANLRRHLAPGGVGFISTPNRLVFSLGHEPSPVNKEHVKEPTLGEFRDLLSRHFSWHEVHGQRFKDPALLRAWEEDVRRKIEQCRAGTRWAERPPLRSRLRRFGVVRRAYQVPLLRAAWRAARWRLGGWLRDRLRPPRSPYLWSDFEMVSGDLADSLWFCAAVRP
jgi:SAM-dependent methyltransferase